MSLSLSAFGLEPNGLPKGWIADRLDTLAFLNPEQITERYPYSEIAYLDIANVSAGTTGEPAKLPLPDAPSRARRIVRPQDSILSTVRPGNRAYAFLQKPLDNLIVSTGFAVLRARPGKADPRYLYYLATCDPIISYLASIAEEKTAYPSVNPDDIAECVVPIPPLAEQRDISHVLGRLDDKIELDRRMSETLEASARGLFKSWFVDFDPVRAKAEAVDVGLAKDLADLFPDQFEDSELGPIPDGWEVSSIGSVAEVVDCLHSRKPERRDSGMPLLQLVNIRDDGLVDLEDAYLIDEADYRKWVTRLEASPGDCLVTNVGRVGAAAQMPVGQKAALGRNMTAVRCKPEFPFPTFLIECLLSQAMRDEIILKMDTGTILDALNVRNIPKLRFVRPAFNILERFEQLARPLRAQMERNLAESLTLAAVRNSLLPRLITGELRVRGVERIVGGAG